MQHSETIQTIAPALLKAQSEIPKIEKNRTATVRTKTGTYEYQYANIDDVLTAIKPILQGHGLLLMQDVSKQDGCVFITTTIIHAESGEFFKSSGTPVPCTNDPQSIGIASTYGRRYDAEAMLGLCLTEDIDADIPQRQADDEARQATQEKFGGRREQAKQKTLMEKLEMIRDQARQKNVPESAICKDQGVDDINELTSQQCDAVISKLEKTKDD